MEFTKNTSCFQAFKAAEEEVQARWKYEDNIKRPYFHMKPLERGQVRYDRAECVDSYFARFGINLLRPC